MDVTCFYHFFLSLRIRHGKTAWHFHGVPAPLQVNRLLRRMSDSLTPRVWMGQDNVGILRSCFGLAKSCRNWTWKKSDVKTSPTSRYFGHFCDTKVRWRISLQTTRRRLQHCHGFAKLKRCQDCYRSLRLKVKGFKLVFQMSAKFPTRLLHLFNKPLYLCGKIPSTIWGSSSGGERFTRVWHPSFIELSTKYEKNMWTSETFCIYA